MNSSWVSSSFDEFAEGTLLRTFNELKSDNKPRKNKCRFKVKNSQELWSEKYKPISKAALAVHKKKIEEVEKWLQEAQKTDILLISGPPGSGKSITVQVLASELHLEIQEWQPPDFESFRQFQSETFQHFLLRTNKYSSVVTNVKQKITLIEDIFNSVKDPQIFHDILRQYKYIGKSPLIFIVTDQSGNSNREWQFFPKFLLEELNVYSISFNPISATLMSKAFTRILTAENNEIKLTKEDINTIILSSCGDIRTGINSLQFISVRGKIEGVRNDAALILGRDISLYLFRALGKILHYKYESDKTGSFVPHFIPEDIIEKSSVREEIFNLYLHQNYLDFLNDVDDIIVASTYFGDSDIICSEYFHLGDYSASLATRGVLQALCHRKISVGWKPLYKPQWFTCFKSYLNNSTNIRNMFRNHLCSPVDLQTLFVPYFYRITESMNRTFPSEIFISVEQICKFSSIIHKDNYSEERDFVDPDENDSLKELIPHYKNLSSEDKNKLEINVSDIPSQLFNDKENETILIEEFDD